MVCSGKLARFVSLALDDVCVCVCVGWGGGGGGGGDVVYGGTRVTSEICMESAKKMHLRGLSSLYLATCFSAESLVPGARSLRSSTKHQIDAAQHSWKHNLQHVLGVAPLPLNLLPQPVQVLC